MLKLPHCSSCGQQYSARGESGHAGYTSRLPLVLDCGHTYCETCITKNTRANKRAACPSCKRLSRLEDEEGVKSLWPDAYIVGNLTLHKRHFLAEEGILKMVPVSSKKKSKERKKPMKEICEECTYQPATCRCLKCEVNMCAECYKKVHSGARSLRTHQAVPLYESEKYEQIQSMCGIHKRPIEYYCEDDFEVICSNCVILGEHKGHAITALEEKNKQAVKDMQSAIVDAQKVMRCLRRSNKQLHRMAPQVQDNVMGVVESIRANFLSLHAQLQAREKALLQQVNKVCGGSAGPVHEKRKEVNDEIEKLESLLKDAQRVQQCSPELIVNAQGIYENLKAVKETPCYLVTTKADGYIKCEFDSSTIEEMIADLGKIAGSTDISVALVPMSEAPEDIEDDETDSVASSQSYSREPSEVDTVETISTLSEAPSVASIDSMETSSTSSKTKSHKRRNRIKRARVPMMTQELVYVVHIKNPCHFIVHRYNDLGKLKSLSIQINKYCKSNEAQKEIPATLQEDDEILAQFGGDLHWYRARVMSVLPNEDGEELQAFVYYIDYGNSETIPISRTRKMKKKYQGLPGQAVVCSLFDIVPNNESGEWTMEPATTFARMTGDRPMSIKVIEVKDNVYFVDLRRPALDDIEDDRPISMRDALVFLDLACLKSNDTQPGGIGPLPKVMRRYLTEHPPRKGTALQLMVSHALSPHHFYVQQIGEEARYLTEMMNELQEVYNKDKNDLWTIFCPVKDQICVAKYPLDGAWYRAQVKHLPGKQMVQVKYVDFGNEEQVPYFELKQIMDKFLRLPVMAMPCCLADVEPINEDDTWPIEAAQLLTQFSMKPMVAKVEGMVQGRVSLVLYDTSTEKDICMNALLVQQGLAASTGEGSVPQELQVIPEKLVKSPHPPSPGPRSPPPQQGLSFDQIEKFRDLAENTPLPTSPQLFSSSSEATPPPEGSPLGRDVTSPDQRNKSASVKNTISTKSKQGRQPAKPVQPPQKEVSKPQAKVKVKKVEEEERSPYPMVKVTQAETPGHFYVQMWDNDCLEKMDLMMTTMQEAYSGSEPTTVLFTPSDYCAVQYSHDNFFYRAKVISKKTLESAKVLLIDFGFVDEVSVCQLRPLQEQFQEVPAFSIRCHMANIQPAGDITRWSATACEFLKDTVDNTLCYILQKGDMEEGSLPVDLLLREEKMGDALNPDRVEYNSIATMLVTKGLALPMRNHTPGKKYIPTGAKDRIISLAIPPRPLSQRKAPEPSKQTPDAPEEDNVKSTNESFQPCQEEKHTKTERNEMNGNDSKEEKIGEVTIKRGKVMESNENDEDKNATRSKDADTEMLDMGKKLDSDIEEPFSNLGTEDTKMSKSESSGGGGIKETESPGEDFNNSRPAGGGIEKSDSPGEDFNNSRPPGGDFNNSRSPGGDFDTSRPPGGGDSHCLPAADSAECQKRGTEAIGRKGQGDADHDVQQCNEVSYREPVGWLMEQHVEEWIAALQPNSEKRFSLGIPHRNVLTQDKIVKMLSAYGEVKDVSMTSRYFVVQYEHKTDALKALYHQQEELGIIIPTESNPTQTSPAEVCGAGEESTEAKSDPSPAPEVECGEKDSNTESKVVKGVGKESVVSVAPPRFLPPQLPPTSSLTVIPTFVDWHCTIFCQPVNDIESASGRFGYILKENTLESILQDQYLIDRGLYRAHIPRDGNCLFRAFAQGLFSDQSQQERLRQRVVEALTKSWNDLKILHDQDKTKYLKEMGQSGTYGGEPEIITLCFLYKVRAIVCIGGLEYDIQEREYGSEYASPESVIRLIYISDGGYDSGHYDLVVTSLEQMEEAELIYQKWREIRIRQFKQWNMYEDNTTYDESLLQQLMEQLQKIYANSRPDGGVCYEIGQSVIVQYTQDSQYYRGRITDITHKGISVLYIDFGNSELVTQDRLRPDITLTSIPQQCYECELAGIRSSTDDGNWTKKTLEYIHELVVNKQCEIHIEGRACESERLQVYLMLPDGRELSQSLLDMGLALLIGQEPCDEDRIPTEPSGATKHPPEDTTRRAPSMTPEEVETLVSSRRVVSPFPPPLLPLQGSCYPVCVPQMDKPDWVYIQYVKQNEEKLDKFVMQTNEDLEKLMDISQYLCTYAEALPALTDIKPGAACAVMFSQDGRWYRGEVLMVIPDGHNTKVGVLFVDYGSTEIMHHQELRMLPDDLRKLAAQAMSVCVVGVAPPSGITDWPPQALAAFNEIYQNRILVAHFKEVDKELVSVELFDYEDVVAIASTLDAPSVFQPLFEAGLARPVVVSSQGTVIEDPVIEDLDIKDSDRKDPDIQDPDIQDPDIQDPDIQDPDIQDPDMGDPDNGGLDIQDPDKEDSAALLFNCPASGDKDMENVAPNPAVPKDWGSIVESELGS